MNLFDLLKRYIIKYKWRLNNKHNKSSVSGTFNISNLAVGKGTYGQINALMHNEKYKIIVGNYCSIAPNVMFLIASEHDFRNISTFPFKAMILDNKESEALSKGDIVVGDDVWIGYNAIIMSGVCIGQGAIIASGAVVTKDVEPYSIVAGVPAIKIKYRFEKLLREELLKIDYSKLTKQEIEMHIEELYTRLDSPSQLVWLPGKRKNCDKSSI